MSRQRCYVAGPLGFTEAGRDYYERVYLPALATVVEPVDSRGAMIATLMELVAALGGDG